MKKSKRLVLLSLVMLFLMTAPAFGDSEYLLMNGVNIKVNDTKVAASGESYSLETGDIVPYSILYKETTYLPMRRVSELVNKYVVYDFKTKTVVIKDKVNSNYTPVPSKANSKDGNYGTVNFTPNSLNIVVDNKIAAKVGDSCILTDGTEIPFSIVFKGTTYLPMRKMCELVGKNIAWDNDSRTALICDKVENYKDFPTVPDMGLICKEKSIPDTDSTKSAIYYYDSSKVTPIDIQLYTGNLSSNGFTVTKTEKATPDTGSTLLMDKIVYENKIAKTTVTFGETTRSIENEKKPFVYVSISME